MGIFGSDKEIVKKAKGQSVTEKRLFEKSTRSGNRLKDKPIIDYISEGEQVHYILVAKPREDVIEIESDNKSKAIAVDTGYHGFFVVTNEGIVILLGQETGDKVITLSYDEIQYTGSDPGGLTTSKIYLGTKAGKCNFLLSKGKDKEKAIEYISSKVSYSEDADFPSDSVFEFDGDSYSQDNEEESASEDKIRAIELAKEAKSNTVSSRDLMEYDGIILDKLDEDEQPHYVLKGNPIYGIKVEGGTSTDNQSAGLLSPVKTLQIKAVRTILTDKRVILLLIKRTGHANDWFISYDRITGVDKKETIKGMPLIFQTHGRTYYADISEEVNKKERTKVLEESAEYVRKKIQEQSEGTGSGSDSVPPIERLERLKDLHEQGAITDEEFEEKKEDLLDKI